MKPINSFEPFRLYWRLYGGIHALVRSPYIWVAVVVTVLCSPFWLDYNVKEHKRAATELALATIPPMMAFTLAGMAILMALAGAKFLEALREEGRPDSLFMKASALFFHFLFIQTTALLLSLISRTYPQCSWLAAPTFFLTTYSVTAALSIAAMLLNISRVYNLTGRGD